MKIKSILMASVILAATVAASKGVYSADRCDVCAGEINDEVTLRTCTAADQCKESTAARGSLKVKEVRITKSIIIDFSGGLKGTPPLKISCVEGSCFNIALDENDAAVKLGGLIFEGNANDHIINATRGNVYIWNAMFNGKKAIFAEAPVVVKCENCNGTGFELWGRFYFTGGGVTGNSDSAALTIGKANRTGSITSTLFESPSERPYISVGPIESLTIRNNSFRLANGPAAEFLDPSGRPQNILLPGNRYKAKAGKMIAIQQIFKLADKSKMAQLKQPEIKAGIKGEYHLIKILNDFNEDPNPKVEANKSWWGKNEEAARCTKSVSVGGVKRYIWFEPYLLVGYADGKAEAVYPIGQFGHEMVAGANIVKIDVDKKVRIGNKDVPVSGNHITMMVHCYGSGSTNFSEPVRLGEAPAVAPPPQPAEGGEPQEENPCEEGQTPYQRPDGGITCCWEDFIYDANLNKCILRCDEDELFDDAEWKCYKTCQSNAECFVTARYDYCDNETGRCEWCMKGLHSMFLGEAGNCPEHAQKVPDCGNICSCEFGYQVAMAGDNKSICTKITCPEGEVLNDLEECFNPGIVEAPKKGGGCSLMR